MAQSGFDTRLSGPKIQALNTYALLFIDRVLNLHVIIKLIQREDQVGNVADFLIQAPTQ